MITKLHLKYVWTDITNATYRPGETIVTLGAQAGVASPFAKIAPLVLLFFRCKRFAKVY